jgi:hypothetical protein
MNDPSPAEAELARQRHLAEKNREHRARVQATIDAQNRLDQPVDWRQIIDTANAMLRVAGAK